MNAMTKIFYYSFYSLKTTILLWSMGYKRFIRVSGEISYWQVLNVTYRRQPSAGTTRLKLATTVLNLFLIKELWLHVENVEIVSN
jgi:hypothetical protein